MALLDQAMMMRLRASDLAAIQQAHTLLVNDGYAFIGYHGCSMATLRAIVPFGFDATRIGEGDGTARGRGFYVARRLGMAEDYADSGTQDGDPDPKTFQVPRKPGAAGEQAVLRIYARHFRAMQLGTDYSWGVLSNDGDPNGDRGIMSRSGRAIAEATADLELVLSPNTYPRLAALPQAGGMPDHVMAGLWKNYSTDLANTVVSPRLGDPVRSLSSRRG